MKAAKEALACWEPEDSRLDPAEPQYMPPAVDPSEYSKVGGTGAHRCGL